jgi:hypothetical protein
MNKWLDYSDWLFAQDWYEQREFELREELSKRQDLIDKLKAELNEYKKIAEKAEVDRKEKEESTKKVAKDITMIVDGFLGLEKGSVFVLNQELGVYEHNWSNENVTRNVSFSANMFDRNSKFFQVLSWVEENK